MSQIKLIEKDTDLKKALHPLHWDVVIKGEPYQAFFVYEDTEDGNTIYYKHCEGARYEYVWACPRDEEPSYENLIEFDGFPCCWSIRVNEENVYRTKWGETSCERKYIIDILRNGEVFNTIFAYDMLYGISKANVLITEYKEHTIPLNDYNFREELVGRKIRYRGIPAIVDRYVDGQACIIIKPLEEKYADEFFSSPHKNYDEYIDGYYEEAKSIGYIKTEITSPFIWWWYNEKEDER